MNVTKSVFLSCTSGIIMIGVGVAFIIVGSIQKRKAKAMMEKAKLMELNFWVGIIKALDKCKTADNADDKVDNTDNKADNGKEPPMQNDEDDDKADNKNYTVIYDSEDDFTRC